MHKAGCSMVDTKVIQEVQAPPIYQTGLCGDDMARSKGNEECSSAQKMQALGQADHNINMIDIECDSDSDRVSLANSVF